MNGSIFQVLTQFKTLLYASSGSRNLGFQNPEIYYPQIGTIFLDSYELPLYNDFVNILVFTKRSVVIYA